MTLRMESVTMLGPGVAASLGDFLLVLRMDGSLSSIAIVPGSDWHLFYRVSRATQELASKKISVTFREHPAYMLSID